MQLLVQPIPAIDLLGGRCVRLLQGAYDQVTTYHEDPVAVARRWYALGAGRLHVVDLDAAKGGPANNAIQIEAITKAIDIPVQTGGGVRTIEDVERALALGIRRVIIGTAAVRRPEFVSEALRRFGPERVAVGIDARNGEVRVQGWTKGSGLDALAFAVDMESRGIRRIIYTDISRDGTMQGPNLDAYRALGSTLQYARITASGGVAGYEDLKALQTLAPLKVDSVIVGRALYEGRFEGQILWEPPRES